MSGTWNACSGASAALAFALAAPAAPGPGEFAPGQVVVRLTPQGSIDEINEEFGSSVLAAIAAELTFLLSLPPQVNEVVFVQLLESLEITEWAELNVPVQVLDGTTGSFFVYVDESEYHGQYAVNLINPVQASSAQPVRVAILDTGVDAAHPALAAFVGAGGYDFVDGDADPADAGNGLDDDGDGDVDELVGHGTHLAGLVALAACDAEIMPLRVLDSDGRGLSFQAAQGIHYALDQGAAVINLSFTCAADVSVLSAALDRARQEGAVVVAAAGNSGASEPVPYPAGHPLAVAVAATDVADLKCGFSNYGDHVALSAPGVQIASTLPGGAWGAADGTSFASALVAGGAAAIAAQDPGAGPEEIIGRLLGGAVPIDAVNPPYAGMLGAGRLDIAAALALGAATCPADLDDDGFVGVLDLFALLAAWGPAPGHPADQDGDGSVAVGDFLSLLAAWGVCP
jgi:subtilisin family serine protease